MSSNKRQKISLQTKFEIIQQMNDKSVNRNDLLTKYKLKSLSHLTNIWTNRENIIKKYETIDKKLSKNTSRVRNSNFPKVEEVLKKNFFLKRIFNI